MGIEVFSPPNLIQPHTRQQDALASRVASMAAGMNRMNVGVQHPGAEYPDIRQFQPPPIVAWVVGCSPYFLACSNVNYAIPSISPGQGIFAVLKPKVLRPNVIGTPVWTYSTDNPPVGTFGYTVTYSEYSVDGNARVATRSSDGAQEVQVIDALYALGDVILAMPFVSADPLNFVPTDYPFTSLDAEGDTIINTATELGINGPIYYMDTNVDARHWVAQTLASPPPDEE